MTRLNSIKDLEIVRTACVAEKNRKPITITVCSGTGCTTCGSTGLADTFLKEIQRQGLYEKVSLRRCGCYGFCEQGPVTTI